MKTEQIKKRDQGHLRLGAVAVALSLGVGALIGWNAHETSDVRANYIADLPACVVAK